MNKRGKNFSILLIFVQINSLKLRATPWLKRRMGRWGDGEMRGWGDGGMGGLGDGKMGRWGDGVKIFGEELCRVLISGWLNQNYS
jgi:hypothetical protein